MVMGKTVAGLMCCAMVASAEWPTYHGGAGLAGVSETVLPENPERLWRFDAAGGAVCGTPVSDGERIFFSAKRGGIVALDQEGSGLWEKSFTRTNDAGAVVSVRFEAPLACGEGFVFAGSTRGTLYALDARTGALRWKYETDGRIVGSPNFVEPRKVVVLDQSEGALHCVDAATGKSLWKSEGMERCDGAPGVGTGKVVFGSCLAALHVFSSDGKYLRDIEVGGDGGQIAGGVAVDGALAFAGLRSGSLVCADLEAGDLLWSSDLSDGQTFSTPAVTSNRVVYASGNGFVYVVKKRDGTPVWKFETGGLPTSPVVGGDKVAVSADGVLFLLELATGKKVWSKEVGDEISSPALVGGMMVVGADDGTVGAFGRRGHAEAK